ncbi:cyclin-related protein FAM58A-like protein [Dinothrombium tinctorium]|uniref:Cyclin-Q n=1 Tax=Dinothrombium tinctorium TaxID=1965070 RepID=A0A3S3QPT2_9ACAR|nr:cyclin-related protein FAM58A-like protein [Dinothrombium tinctorium]RWS12091.1 cyclin-related protein FAM58A-like protein [Dinothrombium tinctorium]RWS12094.1 cyclin-related protein FAM58A-like protein [Dinothrombium tinctorium]
MSPKEAISVLFKSCNELKLQRETWCAAAVYFHRFFEQCSSSIAYDANLIAATCLYLASKVEEDKINIRNLIAVYYSTMHKERGEEKSLDSLQEYLCLKESIVRCELLVLRMLQFNLNYEKPHKHLRFYLTSLTAWLGKDRQIISRLSHNSKAFLNDFYRSPRCFHFKINHIAIAVIQFALECNQIKVPYDEKARVHWQQALCEDITEEIIETIIQELCRVYEIYVDLSKFVESDAYENTHCS